MIMMKCFHCLQLHGVLTVPVALKYVLIFLVDLFKK